MLPVGEAGDPSQYFTELRIRSDHNRPIVLLGVLFEGLRFRLALEGVSRVSRVEGVFYCCSTFRYSTIQYF